MTYSLKSTLVEIIKSFFFYRRNNKNYDEEKRLVESALNEVRKSGTL